MTQTPEPRFEFTLSEKQNFLVVSLKGTLNKATAADVQACEKAALASTAKYIVLNFQDVTYLDLTGVRPLVQLQKAIREKPAQLKLCFLKKTHFELLQGAAAVRGQEISADLAQALKSFDIPLNQR